MINDHLDKVQEKLIKELYAKEENESKIINQLLSEIEETKKRISDLQVDQNTIKNMHQNYRIALKHLEKEVLDQEKIIQSVLQRGDMKIKTLSLVIDEEVQKICKTASFGSVSVESKSYKTVIGSNKNKQAQMMVPILVSKCIDDIELNNKMEISLKSTGDVRGCAILPNGKMMFCDRHKRKIIAVNSNGTHEFKMVLNTNTFDMTYIEGEDTIAVTSGYHEKAIHIIDTNSRTIERSINTSASSYGITLNKNVLVYCESGKGITEVQTNGESEKTLVQFNIPPFSYVAVHGDNIYYTDKDNHSVTCYNIHRNL